MSEYKDYYITADIYQEAADVPAKCADITFLNVGDGATPPTGADLFVLNTRLAPGVGIEISANENERDLTHYKIYFRGAGVRNCTVYRKNYQEPAK